MEHEMILASADMREVYARLTAKRKVDAPVAQVGEHSPRKGKGESSNDSGCPSVVAPDL